ncbi:MAG: hypothetical protein U5R31_11885 [Acidimicrobiia bacterium]|nr:hypothetical protein [Acidimicrobiia bacterium]
MGTRGGLPGYEDTAPSTLNAWRNTLGRSFMHRKLWANDPDCLMLRSSDTEFPGEAIGTWARAVAMSGGWRSSPTTWRCSVVRSRELLDFVVELGRAVDDEAMFGRPPRCPDLLDAGTPTTIEAGELALRADPRNGTSELEGSA